MCESVKRIAVIGAGAAGLVSIKSCLEEGLEVVCYEKTSNIAGLWYYRSELPEGVGRIPKTTISNTSKEITAFSDFPFPKDFPNYMHHKKICEYFDLYAKRFDLFRHIIFEHSVMKVDKSNDYDSTHKLKVTVKNLRDNSVVSQIFDGVMVCTGHHTTPNWPEFPGQQLFKGKIIHSRDMTSQLELAEFEDKSAVVVGIGNSGCDCAVELSNICFKTYMALRRKGWVINKVGQNGLPIDTQIHTRFLHKIRQILPFPLVCWYFETFYYNERFNHRLFGLEPDFRCFEQQAIANDALPSRMLCGKIIAKNNIERFTENGVIFIGEESETKCDLVVMATGYHYTFPLIDESLFQYSSDKPLDLYKHVFPKQLPHWSLALIGVVQPTGGIFPLFEMQSRWYAMLMTGKCQYQTNDQIVTEIAETNKKRDQIYYSSPRNNLGVDWIIYMDSIAHIIGVKPDLQKYLFSDTTLFIKLVFGTCLPYQYRLKGRHSWSGARDAIMQSDYRVRYALNPNEAKSENYFCLTPTLYKIVFSLFLILFAFIIFEVFD